MQPLLTLLLDNKHWNMWSDFHILEATSLEQVIQRSICEQGWVRQHPSFSDSTARPSTRPSSHICKNQLWSGSNLCSWYMEGNNKNFTYVYVFHRRCLLTILGISWWDHFTNDELMKRVEMKDLWNIVRVRRLTLAGHILWLPPDRPASVAMQWEPDEGRRRWGCPRKTWQQRFPEDLQEMRVRWNGVRRVASGQSRSKSLVTHCCSRSGRI